MSSEDQESESNVAPDEVIAVGALLTDAREYLREAREGSQYGPIALAAANHYLVQALMEYEPLARAALANEKKRVWQNNTPSLGLMYASEACQTFAHTAPVDMSSADLMVIEHKIGAGHKALSDMIEDLGYDRIRNRDMIRVREKFKIGGGGGGR